MSIALDMNPSLNQPTKNRFASSSNTSSSAAPTCSIVVPAFRENGNLRPLVTRLFSAFSSTALQPIEVLIVDDNSNDGSTETVSTLQGEGYNVRIIVRTAERGLSSAVVRGFREAAGERMICMDADLQHPPEAVPRLVEALGGSKTFVLGTRYGAGVEMDKDWPLHRRIISSGARLLALPLTSASDPMSGFFGITKQSFDRADHNINAQGFKIALDLLVKSGVNKDGIAEVPFSFGLRQEGESKLDGKVMLKYVEQLVELYRFRFGTPTCVLVLLLAALLALWVWLSVVSPVLFG